VTAIVVLAVGVVAAALTYAVTYAASGLPVVHDVASAARMPIPGTADANLAARSYGLYFGMRNAPSRVQIRAPALDIKIVPPKGIRDPELVEVSGQGEVFVDGFHTKQVARITVYAPGRYHVHVESPEESGGSFSIGELPAVKAPDSDRALAYAAPVGLVALVVSALLAVGAVLVWRATNRSNVASPRG
jgi:hypothetical protein